MLHVLVGVGQVLYAYNLDLKEGNVPNEFGTADLTFFFFPPFTWSFSSCVSLPSLLQEDCRQDWIPKSPLSTYCEVTLAGQMISVVSKGHPVSCTSGWLLKELFLEGVCTLGEPLPILPFPLAPLPGGGRFFFFTVGAKAGASSGVEDLRKQLSGFSLVPCARSLGGLLNFQIAVKCSH